MRPKAKNPVLLVLIGLPVATLAAGFATLAIIGRGGLDTVGDPVRRTAQVQQVDLAADEAARRMDLVGHVAVDGTSVRVTVPGIDAGTTLRLRLEHPLDAAQDTEIVLTPGTDHWRAPAFDANVGWRLALLPADGAWRLVARWPRGARAIGLAPAVASDAPPVDEAGHGPG
jgi:hypothetical protein